jgi:hypothetical protein
MEFVRLEILRRWVTTNMAVLFTPCSSADVSGWPAALLILKMEAVCSFETSKHIHHTTQHAILRDSDPQLQIKVCHLLYVGTVFHFVSCLPNMNLINFEVRLQQNSEHQNLIQVNLIKWIWN